MDETWRDVVGYEGRYMVSTYGRVKSLFYLGHPGERVLKLTNHHTGYFVVSLFKNSKKKLYSVHILVAQAFIPNKEGKRCVNHIDGNKHNNHVENLEWVSHLENTKHAIHTGLRDPHNVHKKLGADNVTSKPVLQYSLDGAFICRWDSQSDAARALGVRPGTIHNCVDKLTKKCNGFMWRSIPQNGIIQDRIAPFSNRLSDKEVTQFDLNHELIRSWSSFKDIYTELGLKRKSIHDCCMGRQKTCGGFIWEYVNQR